MAKLINRHAMALLRMAKEQGKLDELYRQALLITQDKEKGNSSEPVLGDEMSTFIRFVLQGEVSPVLERFAHMAREQLGIAAVEAVSAVPLTDEQRAALKATLERRLGRQVELSTREDASLLGGLRITVGDRVIDTTIKTRLAEMKKSVCEGVQVSL